MEDFEGERRHDVYQGYRIASEADGYRLTAVNYTGDAGDSLGSHSGQRFSTKDRDQDSHSNSDCAKSYLQCVGHAGIAGTTNVTARTCTDCAFRFQN